MHAVAAASVHHTYVGEDRRILASPCTGLSIDRTLFLLLFVGTPFIEAGLRSTSLAELSFRLGLAGLWTPLVILQGS